MEKKKYTIVGTDINEVKRLNATMCLSYNEAKTLLSKLTEAASIDENPLESVNRQCSFLS